MKSLKFKTNIKCEGCVANVTPHLDAAVGEENWQVDTTSPLKILTVEALSEQSVIDAVQKAGFKIEKVD
jgi:copper chaperone